MLYQLSYGKPFGLPIGFEPTTVITRNVRHLKVTMAPTAFIRSQLELAGRAKVVAQTTESKVFMTGDISDNPPCSALKNSVEQDEETAQCARLLTLRPE